MQLLALYRSHKKLHCALVSYNSSSVYIVEELVSYNNRYSNIDASCNERHLNGILEHDYWCCCCCSSSSWRFVDPQYYNCLLLRRRKRNMREREEVANSESRALQELWRWCCCSEPTCGSAEAGASGTLAVNSPGQPRGPGKKRKQNRKFLIGFL